jgi:hypothetical protein
MSEIAHISEDLFFKLRNRFPKVNMGDENGQVTTNPLDSRFFNFKFEHEDKKYGNVTCSLIDNQSLKIYFNQDITINMDEPVQEVWFQFLKELRKFAKINMLTFDVRDIEKDSLDQKDIDFVSKYAKEKSAVQESKINWERHGRFSEGNHKSIKIHVVHKNRMDENPNNRLIGIDKIYLVNENKERFLLPFVSISGAKAMAMHCAQGGTPYDNDGTTITKAVAEMKNLSRFGMALRNKTFESEEPVKVIRASKHIKEQIKKNLHRMAGARSFSEGMEGLRGLLANESTDKTEVLKDWFIQSSYDDKIDTWLESATNALRRCMEQNVDLNEEGDKIDYSDAILDKDQTAKRAANPAKVGSSLELYANPSKDEEMKALIKSQPMRGMIKIILADIANRATDDEVAVLASRADEGDFTPAHKKMIEAYLKDLYGNNPPRKEPEAKKDLYGKRKSPEEEFEEEIMAIGEDECPHCGMSPCHCGDHDQTMWEGEEEEMEAIGDRHKSERFKSIKKIKSRLGEEPDEEHVHESDMEAGVCNETPAGSMCPVHGMEECGSGNGGVSMVVGEEGDRKVSEEMKRMLRLAGLNENYVYAQEEDEVDPNAAPTDPAAAPAADPAMDDAMAKFNIDDWGKVQALKDYYIEKGANHDEAQETAAQDLGYDPAMVSAWAEKNEPSSDSHHEKSSDDDGNDDFEGGNEISKFGEAEIADEGNEFSGALAKAKASHKDEFEVGGKTYKVKEDAKPDYLDFDKDGDKKEPMKKALKDKEKTDEALEILKKAAGIW